MLQAVDNLLRRTPATVLPGDKTSALLRPLHVALDDLAHRVYGSRVGGVGHGGSLEKTSRFPDPNLFPWEWPALEYLIQAMWGEDEIMYLPITGPNKGTLSVRTPESSLQSPAKPLAHSGKKSKAKRARKAMK